MCVCLFVIFYHVITLSRYQVLCFFVCSLVSISPFLRSSSCSCWSHFFFFCVTSLLLRFGPGTFKLATSAATKWRTMHRARACPRNKSRRIWRKIWHMIHLPHNAVDPDACFCFSSAQILKVHITLRFACVTPEHCDTSAQAFDCIRSFELPAFLSHKNKP